MHWNFSNNRKVRHKIQYNIGKEMRVEDYMSCFTFMRFVQTEVRLIEASAIL